MAVNSRNARGSKAFKCVFCKVPCDCRSRISVRTFGKGKRYFLCLNVDNVSHCKRMYNSAICNNRKISEATLELMAVAQIIHSVFLLFFFQQLLFFWKIYWKIKKSVWQFNLIQVHNEPMWLTEWKADAQREFLFLYLETRNVSLKTWKSFLGIWKILRKKLRSHQVALHFYV